jgi:uncharacterized protein (DUF2236 family)
MVRMMYGSYHMTETLFPTDEEIPGLLAGPDSVSWRYGSDVRFYALMLYPLLMQVSHPTVGSGVRDFSNFEQRPWQRLFQTLDYLLILTYGGADAVAMGRRLRELHKRFRGANPDGSRYSALEPESYAWVHATLLEAFVSGHERFGRPMSRDQIERFYREQLGLGRLVGVREGHLPADWDGFREYFDATIETTLDRNETVDRVLRATRHVGPPPLPAFPNTLWRAVRLPARKALLLGGIGLLPPVLRQRFGVRWTAADEAAFRAFSTASRSLTPAMPKRLLVTGPAQLRWRRRAIARGPLGRDAATATEQLSRAAAGA